MTTFLRVIKRYWYFRHGTEWWILKTELKHTSPYRVAKLWAIPRTQEYGDNQGCQGLNFRIMAFSSSTPGESFSSSTVALPSTHNFRSWVPVLETAINKSTEAIWILAYVQRYKQAKIVKNSGFIFNSFWHEVIPKTFWHCFWQASSRLQQIEGQKVVSAEWLAGGHLENHLFCCICHTNALLIITFELNSSQYDTYAQK